MGKSIKPNFNSQTHGNCNSARANHILLPNVMVQGSLLHVYSNSDFTASSFPSSLSPTPLYSSPSLHFTHTFLRFLCFSFKSRVAMSHRRDNQPGIEQIPGRLHLRLRRISTTQIKSLTSSLTLSPSRSYIPFY